MRPSSSRPAPTTPAGSRCSPSASAASCWPTAIGCWRRDDAQDMTQETFLRAWAKRESFQGRASLRTWLYRIATNACLDFLEKRRDRTPIPTDLQGAGGTGTEVLYLQPWPDSQPDDPHERAVTRETIELAFIVA